MKSSRKSTDLTANTPYYSRPIRRVQDFDESKDHCPTLKNTPYPHQRYTVYNTLVNKEEQAGFKYAVSIKKIRRIHAYTSPDTTKDLSPICRIQEHLYAVFKDLLYTKLLEDIKRGPYSKKAQYAVKMDDPNITMEEYIRLEEEKARRRGKVYNWETATYGKIWDNEDVHDLRSVETEFPAIALNYEVSSKTLSCEPTVSSLNDEINFRISFDESDDEDYTIIFDKNSFSHKIISANDLKTDSENDNEKVNMPSLLSPEPTVNYFKDFENEFPAIVYNDAQTANSDFSTEPALNPQHIDEFDLKSETSFSKCDEEEQNILNFNDLFPFNVIYPNDSKSDKDNDDDKIDIEHSLGDLSVKPLPDVINMDVGAYDLVKEISTNIGGEFTYLEILKCWSLENFKAAVQHEILLINANWRIYRANIRGVSHSNSF
ncbi:hypothetical protein Tco_1533675 [Tanacetum coccineum]